MALERAKGASAPRLPVLYRLFRSFFRFLTNVWFREVSMVDDEGPKDDAGVLFVTWHPNGLVDPMLMTARLEGRLTTLVHHRLFAFPGVGWLFRSAGVVPIGMTDRVGLNLGGNLATSTVLATTATTLANGGRVLMFPEEATHGRASVQNVRSGAARLLLTACREAEASGRPLPHVVPVGLHYSDSSRFRERAAIVLDRPMSLPCLPEGTAEADDRRWVLEVTQAIGVELQRANLAKTTWEERTLIWKGRSLVQAEKGRQQGQRMERHDYATSLLAARRLRAGWEFMRRHDPSVADALADRCRSHFDDLESRSLTPYDVDARPETVTARGAARAMASWSWAVVWMFGLMTWGAMLGNYTPYKFQALLERWTRRAGVDDTLQGSIKVLSSVVVFPVWWLSLSLAITWVLLDISSPVYQAFSTHQLLYYLTLLPPLGVAVVLMLFWPLSARAHMGLYARLVRATRSVRRWLAWRDESNDWDELVNTQRELAGALVALGSGLVLPGDPEWQDPPSGRDDADVVQRRSAPVM